MSERVKGNRPLSPHLTIYRPQMSSISSILVRISGVSLSFGFVLIVWWLLAASTNIKYFESANSILSSWFGIVVLIGSVWALCYHSLGGIRHLIWDMGYGFDLKTADRMGWAVIIGSFVLTFVIICYSGALS
ncbi:succinate dehydrogenase, cytochrome b556 subunit [Amylibacter sp.]|nr:succinate dehydrogenase, cytochrome b556 subunit [Amylibacter sp.]MDB4235549.1 succinate dehydrogenase, cytochrome b556 subunit [bacterium]MDA8913513.1 succinate dehydrogenase, cytochrome b556 subunit [Amylibacter sp.]MDA9290589.1 succinate dehydrogenase, cytochrome b556 subunit [Amylibacter sp.]MDA9294023.1 succinate dehydrogenase, cytochrome b556 subunit [Amylibacter sp.]|tara:strand:+ start:295 stop:690 length:396 start_codon:yes stop_codon:yes gene_type:complete